METKNKKVPETHKWNITEIINTFLGVLCFICLLTGAECINSVTHKKYVIYLFDIMVILILVVIPMIDLVGESKDENRHIRNFTMFIDIILAVMLCILSYFIFKVQFLANIPYYSAINKLGIATLVFILIKIIIEYTKKTIQHYDRSKSKLSYVFGAVILFFAFINLAAMPFIRLYKSKTIIYTKNIKIPYKFEVMKIDKEKTVGSYKDNIIGTINDTELINKIYGEIINREYENIRNLDELNNMFFTYNNNQYYEMDSDYVGLSGAEMGIRSISSGYIFTFKVYSDGQVEITDHSEAKNRFGYPFLPRYRVYLLESTKNELLKAIKALE